MGDISRGQVTDIVLKDPAIAQKIIKLAEENPYLVGRIKSLGYRDLELNFCLKNPNQLHQIIGDISSKFPDSIKDYKFEEFSTLSHIKALVFKHPTLLMKLKPLLKLSEKSR